MWKGVAHGTCRCPLEDLFRGVGRRVPGELATEIVVGLPYRPARGAKWPLRPALTRCREGVAIWPEVILFLGMAVLAGIYCVLRNREHPR